MLDSSVQRNFIFLETIGQLNIFIREKKEPYCNDRLLLPIVTGVLGGNYYLGTFPRSGVSSGVLCLRLFRVSRGAILGGIARY
jgi:hypothetical protein